MLCKQLNGLTSHVKGLQEEWEEKHQLWINKVTQFVNNFREFEKSQSKKNTNFTKNSEIDSLRFQLDLQANKVIHLKLNSKALNDLVEDLVGATAAASVGSPHQVVVGQHMEDNLSTDLKAATLPGIGHCQDTTGTGEEVHINLAMSVEDPQSITEPVVDEEVSADHDLTSIVPPGGPDPAAPDTLASTILTDPPTAVPAPAEYQTSTTISISLSCLIF